MIVSPGALAFSASASDANGALALPSPPACELSTYHARAASAGDASSEMKRSSGRKGRVMWLRDDAAGGGRRRQIEILGGQTRAASTDNIR